MAMDVAQHPAFGLVNGASPSPPPADKEKVYDQLLQLRDVVLTGKHAQFKLPPSAVEQLKASLHVPPAPAVPDQSGTLSNRQASTAANVQQIQGQPSPSALAPFGGLPGLQNGASTALNGSLQQIAPSTDATRVNLDPIFLQKSENLVREEIRLKRERLERDLQIQREQRKLQPSSRDKDPALDAPSRIDINLVLHVAMDHVKHVSGLKAAGSPASSSFDENDYYSSLVQSDWSSETSSTKGSDRATGDFTADYERLDGSASKAKRKVISAPSASNRPKKPTDVFTAGQENFYGMDEEDDDEYTPPDATAFDSSRVGLEEVSMQHVLPEGDDSDYEPGEITAEEIFNASPRYQPQQRLQPPTNVPVIRNHLTHIAAPQPNRVSPLTTTKDSNIELELVNGRPEIVQKPSYQAHQMSRVSSASPTGHSGAGMSKKQKTKKKRKRDTEPQGRNKRRQKQVELEPTRSPLPQEPYIKPEPVSPPPSFANLPPAPDYGYAQPPQVDLTANRPAQYTQYPYESQPRHQHGALEPQQVIRVASPAQRPHQRDTQDLRRVASLHTATRASPPRSSVYSPIAPYRTMSMGSRDTRLQPPAQDSRPRSPMAAQRYDDAYSSRAASPALMPPPPLPPPPARRIVQDQYGNRYYAADNAPSQLSSIRASAVPESFERAPSRATYAQAPAAPQYYERVKERMPPSQPLANGAEEPFEYTDADGYLVRGYRIRPAERSQPQPQPHRYSEVPTSPAYQQHKPYEQMPPPPIPQATRHVAEPTSPTYDPNFSRSYSARPEQPPPPQPNYLRQASVAPIQYAPLRQGSVAPVQYTQQQPAPSIPHAPQRATSVMPGYEYAPDQQQPHQQVAPMFVDQYGNPVYPREVREVRQVDDYYHA